MVRTVECLGTATWECTQCKAMYMNIMVCAEKRKKSEMLSQMHVCLVFFTYSNWCYMVFKIVCPSQLQNVAHAAVKWRRKGKLTCTDFLLTRWQWPE